MPEKNLPLTDQWLTWVDHRRWILLGLVPVLYLAAFNGQWRPGPDSAEHVVIAQRIIDGQGFTHPTGLHERHYVGLAYMLAGLGMPFGHVAMFVSHLAMLLVTLATLAMAMAVLRQQYNRATAVLLTLMLALTETFYQLGYDLLTDMPFCFGLMAMLLGWAWVENAGKQDEERGESWWGWVMLAVGVVIMTLFRSVVVSVLVGVALTVAWRLVRGPGRWRAAVIGGVCFASWLVARLGTSVALSYDEGRVVQRLFEEMPHTLWRMVTVNLPKLATENAAEALFAVDLGPVISVVMLLAIIVAWVQLVRTNLLWGMIVAGFVIQWLLFMPGDRYFLPVMMPLLVGWWETARWIERRWSGPRARLAAAAVIVFWIAPNTVRIGSFIVEQRRVPFLEYLSDGQYLRLQALAEQLRTATEPDALIIGSDGSLLTWYSGRAVMDPKQLWSEVDDAENRRQIARVLRPYEHLYIIKPYESRYRVIMRSIAIDLDAPILTVDRDPGETPWTLQPAVIKPKMLAILRRADRKLSIKPDKLDNEQGEQPDREDE